ncbi:hypothetical protein EIN_398810 [Entamoeba invadens IP1]|uniref:G protein-coupled receptor GPR1/2/3 C-terminal domain-containing protein n=1 Tax=Entamoeba invadens IP1 TaxID=370355 RepID=A0A0A1UDN4_ENTIV|nr:hypothetical protein EIN_398810 [Entamoeba invadens IP1]ELP91911.1 hypothetical protein EIN_398810 [Entamoeba invadens IP1]|eukprot:XP_004258682.1 hypothetical protein EIN_398810 [Entamoeba invadens IP1]
MSKVLLLLFVFHVMTASATEALNLSQTIALLVENTLTSSLSLISTLFVAYSMVYLRLLAKGISHQMIFCLLCCSFVNQCVVLATLFILQMSQMVADNTCKFFAAVMQFTDLSQCFWVLAIAVHIGISYFVQNTFIKKNYFVISNIFVWGSSLVLSIIPIDDYGMSEVWCTTTNKYWDFFTLYIVVAIVAVIVFVIYIAVIIQLVVSDKNLKLRHLFAKLDYENGLNGRVISLIRKMAIYPLLYIACWLIPFIDRLVPLFGDDIQVVLKYIHCFTIPLLGFMNCLYYAKDVSLMVRWRIYFRNWGMCYSCIGNGEEIIPDD